ncbi:YesK family protein [Terribacillus saccharophilus]|uniref:YesK-like protein n=1 Tax=Terribacillus saccharophilus TaxID=361277 RepID=A0A268AFQ0_9BACI|nr:YesK family protein [Terribacillus saccharophilus]PAD22946.1 hypothetical protein CHH64_04390 [Terribacillus saccharophilus]PAF17989.1 hypothetical protein CHH51_10460 [Terribacillus saccharophilus]
MNFFLATVLLTVVIIGISLIFIKKKPFMYLVPIFLIAISMILYISSFYIGGWGGVGMIALSSSLLISSAAALIIVTLISYFRTE